MRSLLGILILGLLYFQAASADMDCTGYNAVITHGYEIFGASFNPKGEWPGQMAKAIRDACTTPGPVRIFYYNRTTNTFVCDDNDSTQGACTDSAVLPSVFVMDWAAASNDLEQGYSEAAADALFDALVFEDEANPGVDLSGYLHFIGHSRGTAVNSDAVERLLSIGIYVDQVTNLDPHDWGAGSLELASDFDMNPTLLDVGTEELSQTTVSHLEA